MHKKSPWLRGEYTETVHEHQDSKGKPVVIKNGLDSTITTTKELSAGQLSFSVCSGTEKGVKRVNEDNAVIVESLRQYISTLPLNEAHSSGLQGPDGERAVLPEGMDVTIIGILDGHGGRKVAEYTVQELPKLIAKNLMQCDAIIWDDPTATAEMLGEIFNNLDRKVTSDVPNAMREGCTVTLLMMPRERDHRKVYCANVGDSPCYIWRKGSLNNFYGPLVESGDEDLEMKQHAVQLSTLHKPFAISEKDRIITAGATIERGRVNGSLDVTRSIGDVTFKRYGVSAIPSVSFIEIEPTRDSFIALFSDGLNVLGDGERICQRIEMTATVALKQQLLEGDLPDGSCTAVPQVLKATVKSLIEDAVVDYKCQDNCSIVIAHLGNKSIV